MQVHDPKHGECLIMKKNKIWGTYLVEDVQCTLDYWRKKMNKTSRKIRSSDEPDKNAQATSTMEEK